MKLLQALLQFPNDTGPIYKETLEGRFPVEPFNTFSNIFFLVIVIYFSLKVYKDYRNHKFLAFSIPVLFIGFVGGTVYHASRSHEIWLLMDWVPITVLCLAVSVYFLFKNGNTLKQKLVVLTLVLLLIFGTKMVTWPVQVRGSVGYIGTAIGLLLPMVLYLFQTKFRFGKYVLFAVFSFVAAISFRILDKHLDDLQLNVLQMGSHWLWHSFGATAVFFLMKYIFLDSERIKNNEYIKP